MVLEASINLLFKLLHVYFEISLRFFHSNLQNRPEFGPLIFQIQQYQRILRQLIIDFMDFHIDLFQGGLNTHIAFLVWHFE